MATVTAKVSHRGQTSLPAGLRRRWGVEGGGEVGFLHLGGAALIVPGGVAAARAEARRVLAERYDAGLATLEDPALADQQVPISPAVILDDRLLIEELRAGLPRRRRRPVLHTTSYWYYRACRAS